MMYSVQSHSRVSLSAMPWTAACQASLSITNSWSLLKPMSIESMMPSNHLILCCPLLFLPSIFPSIRVFSNELVLHIRWPKHWSFRLSISPSNEHPGLISFRMDWLDLAGHTLGNCPAGVIGQSLEIFLSVVSSVQLLSCVQLFVTPCTAACQASLSFTISRRLLKPMSIDSMMPSIHLILYGPLFLLPSTFPSITIFSDELALHIRWPEYWNFSISPSNEYSRLISFRIDWFDLFAVQGTLRSLLQNRSPKASILQGKVFLGKGWGFPGIEPLLAF